MEIAVVSKDTLLSTAEVADICRVEANTVYSWVARENLPVADRADGMAYFRMSDVIDCIRFLRADRRRPRT